MGAEIFVNEGYGETAQEAFIAVVDTALYDHGHSGYTGTIAEKMTFVMIDLPPNSGDVHKFIDELFEKEDLRIDDKWGPAGCIHIEDDKYIFFGWASS